MKNAIRIGIAVIVVASLVVGYYFYLSHGRTVKEDQPKKESELEKVLAYDLTDNYPQTPREVIKYYNRIMMLYYNSDTPDNQIDALCDQAMMLFDADLLQVNPRDVYIESVRTEIKLYKERNKKMVQADVADTNDIVYKQLDGDDMAYVDARYFTSEGSSYQNTYQKYALRKDGAGKWKIIAFELTDEDGNPQ